MLVFSVASWLCNFKIMEYNSKVSSYFSSLREEGKIKVKLLLHSS